MEANIQDQIDRFKNKNRKLPNYLTEDFPNRGIHEARIEARRLHHEFNGESPTALQYNQMLDYITTFKGIPQYMKRDSSVKKKKNKQDGSISGGSLIKTLRAVRNTQDQRKKEEDQLYK